MDQERFDDAVYRSVATGSKWRCITCDKVYRVKHTASVIPSEFQSPCCTSPLRAADWYPSNGDDLDTDDDVLTPHGLGTIKSIRELMDSEGIWHAIKAEVFIIKTGKIEWFLLEVLERP